MKPGFPNPVPVPQGFPEKVAEAGSHSAEEHSYLLNDWDHWIHEEKKDGNRSAHMFLSNDKIMEPIPNHDGEHTNPLVSPASGVSAHSSFSLGHDEWQPVTTILLAEDEPFVRKAVSEALESAGYKVLLASNAVEALAVLQDEIDPINLLLTDVVMPNVSGHQLALQFRALSPRTEVLLMSGYEAQLMKCENSIDGIGYLAKPFAITSLLQKVREELKRKSCGLRASD